jgi:hypothetical protein
MNIGGYRMLKKTVSVFMALIVGVILALYGVFLSVFADGNINERLMLIGIVLLIFFVISYVLTKFNPHQAVLNVILMASPSIAVLIFQDFSGYIILYISSIIVSCGLGFFLGKTVSKKKSSNP